MHLIWRCRLVSCLLLINPPPVGQTCCIYLVGTIGNYACFYSSRVLVAAVTASPATPAVNAYHGNPRRLHPGENKTPLEEWHKHHTRPRCRCALHAAVFPYHESVQSLLAWLRPHAYCLHARCRGTYHCPLVYPFATPDFPSLAGNRSICFGRQCLTHKMKASNRV